MTARAFHHPRRRALYHVEDRRGRIVGIFVAAYGDALNVADRPAQECRLRGLVVEVASRVQP